MESSSHPDDPEPPRAFAEALAGKDSKTIAAYLSTLRDFVSLCDELDLRIDACASLADGKPARPIDPRQPIENWRAETALFLLSRKGEGKPVPGQGNLFE